MIRHTRGAAAALVLAGLAVDGVGCTAKPIGQLVLVVQTDLSIPKDIDTIRIEAFNDGTLKFQQDYDKIGPDPNTQIRLPGSISLVASSNPADVITIVVSARTGGADGTARIVRKVVTTVPATRVALLPISIGFLCDGQAATDPTGDAVGTCTDPSATCIAGECVANGVDSSTLPTYSPDSVQESDGACFDATQCWTAPTVAMVDTTDCTIPPIPATGVNVALQTEGAGICGPVGCFVTLNSNDPVEGWSVAKDGRTTLPPGVCQQIGTQIVNVVTQPTTAACPTKVAALPTCGPWSSSPFNPAPYTGPVALAGAQARPVALALLNGTLYWTDGGVSGGSGALKSILPAGGTPAAVDSMSQAPRALVAAGTSALFWTDAPGTAGTGSIYRSAGSSLSQVVKGLDSPEGLAIYESTLFWSDFQDGAIYTSPSSGGTGTKLVTGENYPYRVAADGNYVYWTNEGTADASPPDGSVARYQYTAATGTPEVLATAQDVPRAIALDVDSNGVTQALYWATFSATGAIMRVQLGGATPGAPEVVAGSLASPNGIALDATSVYWTNRDDGTVMKLAKSAPAGTKPTVLAQSQQGPGSIAVDSTNLYWVNEGSSSAQSGAILKLAKGQ